MSEGGFLPTSPIIGCIHLYTGAQPVFLTWEMCGTLTSRCFYETLQDSTASTAWRDFGISCFPVNPNLAFLAAGIVQR